MARLFVVALIISLGVSVHADSWQEISPAIESYPAEPLAVLKDCITNDQLFASGSSAVRHLETWFHEFRRPALRNILLEVRQAEYGRHQHALGHAHMIVKEVRKLVDYRTEQALIAVMDAAVRRHGKSDGCSDAVSSLLLRIAAQRDRVWAWAEAIDRLLGMEDERWETEILARRVAESFRRLERSYSQFDRFK